MNKGNLEDKFLEEEEQEQQGPDLNEMFTFDKDKQDDYEAEDLKDYDGVAYRGDDEVTDDPEEEEEEDDDPDANLFGEQAAADDNPEPGEEAAEDTFDADDLAMFNKKLDKNFKDVEELKAFLDGGDKKDAEKSNVNELEQAENVINHLAPLLDRSVTNDETLMRKEYETIAINSGKDITDEDVQFEIDEQIEKLRDSMTLDLRAENLRKELSRVYNESKSTKDRIAAEKVASEAKFKQTETEATQNAFAEIFGREDFFGIKPDRVKLQEAYKKVNSGEFLNRLKSDKKMLAKLAMIDVYENEIHKKASSGLTYSDGIKAVRDEFKSVKEKSSGTTLTNAQKRGSAGSNDNRGLIQSLTS